MNGFQITFLVLQSPRPGKSWKTKFSGPLTWCRNTVIPLSSWTTSRNRRQLLTVKSGSGSENGSAPDRCRLERQRPASFPGDRKHSGKQRPHLPAQSGDRRIFVERLNITPQQLRYVDNSEPGERLLIYENVILPFRTPIPQRSQRYKIMTIKLGEIDIDTR